MSTLRYNERSWAIDLISLINQKAPNFRGRIHKAGGEQTICGTGEFMFPDVLLFGENSAIAMGWELKMPDTQITESELIENAEKKAEILKTSGFLLWNVNIAVMYLKNPTGFSPVKTWNLDGEPATRQTVESRRKDWERLLDVIIGDINQHLESGKILQRTLDTSFNDGVVTELVSHNTYPVAEKLEEVSRKNGRFRAKANLNWAEVKSEYPRQSQWEVLAKTILVSWSNKILFSHVLKKSFPGIQAKLSKITRDSSPSETSTRFKEISAEFNFWNIFQPQLGEEYLTVEAWQILLQIHLLLFDVDFLKMNEGLLQTLLENTVYHSKRRTSGQFATPRPLARLLASLAILNREAVVHDPCCGTGTIARAAFDLKVESGIAPRNAIKEIFASDKVAFPLQMATIALTDLGNIGEILQIYKEGCENLQLGKTIEFRDPNSGNPVPIIYQGADCFISNLPFIQQEDIDLLNPTLRAKAQMVVSTNLSNGLSLDQRSDLYAYIPFLLWIVLNDGGRMGFIASNSWLATEWGKSFRAVLDAFFQIETVLCSGAGRWFKTADVVATLLILTKRNNPGTRFIGEKTQFASINKDLHSLSDNELQEIADRLLAGKTSPTISARCYASQEIMDFEFSWNALFTDVSWLSNVERRLVPITDFFRITRGERRGWDPMFFPPDGNRIEDCYLKPVLKNLRNTQSFLAEPNSKAFCCGKTKAQLRALKHTGALQWIERFEHSTNNTNKPLPKALARAGCQWYEMKP
ncbi:MAG: SAM-dependent methyltransferase, partial [Kiritimatiellales bacterium]|nr:SAM-dependent methyltransferase [Kiritimatiellales bacterium]